MVQKSVRGDVDAVPCFPEKGQQSRLAQLAAKDAPQLVDSRSTRGVICHLHALDGCRTFRVHGRTLASHHHGWSSDVRSQPLV